MTEQDIIDFRLLSAQAELNKYSDDAARIITSEYEKLVNKIGSQIIFESEKQVKLLISKLSKELSRPVSKIFGGAGMLTKTATDGALSWDGAYKGYKPVAMSSNQLAGLALTEKINGKTLTDHLNAAQAQDVINGIKNGRLEGKSIKSMSSQIHHSLAGEVTKRNIETTARTYTATGSSYARELTYKQNDSVINGYRLSAVLENGNVITGSGTCPRCAGLDGQTYAKGEQRPLTPFHPNCRCIFLPQTKSWKELGLDVEEMDNKYRRWTERDLENRRRIDYGTTDKDFPSFFAGKNTAWQDKMIGPKRAELVRKNIITFDDIVDKRTSRLYTIDELVNKYNIKM